MISIDGGDNSPVRRKVKETSVIFVGLYYGDVVPIKQEIGFEILGNSAQKTGKRQLRFFAKVRY